ncbi:hypothetical protein M6D93_04580 [Jatrophihabitans telluris]|uniref:Guanylate cyclase domain-containing protein n=1 Tax=Jatrophihabitans telluris TaxID=2038343 RepID=A0ABY4R070_9ACTN|nr:adenylate/guanylate cyclase domain-containing protein [Jatrophihabitans telluris]UQX89283.1 hypothetical protein M6D93_04580 [Jatrophihabitans telluris]
MSCVPRRPGAKEAGLPSGVVTFMFTDIVGSTRLWESEPQPMAAAMARHDALVEAAVTGAGGHLVRPRGEGDSRFAVFISARSALSAAADISLALQAEVWRTSCPVQVRTAVHSGEAEFRAGDYYGEVVNRCARLRGVAHPGQILVSAATAAVAGPVLPGELSLADLGVHRLKDLARSEHVFQLDHPGLVNTFPPLLSLDRARHNLPVQTSTFVGRQEEVRALTTAVRENRLVTLTGFGGMGKTRLALHVGAELAKGPDGDVWFVDLSGVDDPASVPARIAQALDVRLGADEPTDALVAALRDQPTLLILDNLEQILECSPFVAALLAAVEPLRILATSRQALRVRGERQFLLLPMPSPEPGETLETISTFDAVRLFLDRAVSVRPEFTITAANASAVAAICGRLDGQPLALELAAARMKMLTVDELTHRLDAGLQILGGGSRDIPERHRTLRATIAWSVDALDAEERELLAAMSILSAVADFDLVEAIAGADLDAFAALESLVEKSLVRPVDGERTGYALLVSIRLYAAELLTDDSRRGYRDRHADYLTRRLRELAQASVVSDQVAFVIGQLDHLRAAIAHRRALGPPAAEIALLAGIEGFMVRLGYASEYLSISEHVLALDARPDDRVTILAARMTARLNLGLGVDPAEQTALRLSAGQCSDPMNRAIGLVMLLATTQTASEFSAAHDDVDDALALLDGAQLLECQLGRDSLTARCLRFADPPRAMDAALALLEAEPGLGYADVGRIRLAALLLDAGRGAEALDVTVPLAGATLSFSPEWQTRALCVRAEALHAVGDLDAAMHLAATAFHREIEEDQTPNEAAQVLADLHRVRGELAEALAALDRADGQMPRPLGVVGAANLWRRAVLLRRLGRADQRSADLEHAIDLFLAEPLYGVRDLLACAVETAVRIVQKQPADAARLLGWVDANRRDWVLPFGMEEEIQPLAARLLPSWQAEYDNNRRGDPYPARPLTVSPQPPLRVAPHQVDAASAQVDAQGLGGAV